MAPNLESLVFALPVEEKIHGNIFALRKRISKPFPNGYPIIRMW
jgi:hypothetical protein